MVNRPFPKLAYKFFGPFVVLEKIGNAAYKLELPANGKVHNVFHVSQLKPYPPDHTPVFSDIHKIVDLSALTPEPEVILERRLVKKGDTAIPQVVLIKWTGFSSDAGTWDNICCRRSFLWQSLGGQAPFGVGGGSWLRCHANRQ